MIKLKQLLTESTMHYLPSYSDDGTSDALGDIRERTYKYFNEALRNTEQEVLSLSNEPKQHFIQKWMYANMITTSLQDGHYIEKSLIDRALELYTECLDQKAIEMYIDKDTQEKWSSEIKLVVDNIHKLMAEELESKRDFPENHPRDYYYKPGFMEDAI